MERRGGLKSERAQALFKDLATGLRTTEKGKVKVEEEKIEPRSPGRDPWLGWQQRRQGAAWLASDTLGSLRRWLLGAPSLSGALFLCRETRKLPFDCGSPGRGLGARQRGSEWQRGKGRAPRAPAACRVRSPPGAAAEAAASAAPAQLQPREKRAAPAGRAERATSGTRGGLYPRWPGCPPSEMLYHGAVLALWITLSLLQVSRQRRAWGCCSVQEAKSRIHPVPSLPPGLHCSIDGNEQKSLAILSRNPAIYQIDS